MLKKMTTLWEDDPDDEAPTRRALRQNNIQNEVVVARDGVEEDERTKFIPVVVLT
jgi:hypothetical protein